MSASNFSYVPAILLPLAWFFVALILCGPLCATHAWLLKHQHHDGRVLLVAPLVVLGLVGYAAFFVYYAGPLAGRGYSIVVAVGSWAYVIRSRSRATTWSIDDFVLTGAIALALGLFYLALLYVPHLNESFDTQSAKRFVDPLPPDALLPEVMGNLLYKGHSLRPFFGDWLSSDRPPLQAGLYLLVLPWLLLVKLPVGLGYQCVGTFSQLAWVPAVWLLCRRLGHDRQISFWTIAVLGITGLFVANSVYAWPKLLAAGYTVCAAVLLLEPVTTTKRLGLLGSAAGALGFLAHGSTGFALLGLGLVWCWENWRVVGRVPAFLGVFATIALPWWLYQHFGDPPGDRLLKWHLAGVIAIDPRSFFTALREAYASLAWNEWWEARRANFTVFTAHSLRGVFDLFTTTARVRRIDEFYHGVRAFGVLNLAWLVALLGVRFRSNQTQNAMDPLLMRRLGAWTVVTFAVWMALMFLPGSTYVHQSSYSMFVVAFALAALVLLRAPRSAGVPILAWHVLDFLTTWLPVDAPGGVNWGMIAALILAIVMMAWIGTSGLSRAELSYTGPTERKPAGSL